LNYYVYYKLAPEHVDEFRPRIQSLFDLMQERCGVRGRWMRRRDDPSTYMEVYESVQDEAAFEALLEREGAKLGVARKLERFICV
jgi:quinol monooxygenase YgiN